MYQHQAVKRLRDGFSKTVSETKMYSEIPKKSVAFLFMKYLRATKYEIRRSFFYLYSYCMATILKTAFAL